MITIGYFSIDNVFFNIIVIVPSPSSPTNMSNIFVPNTGTKTKNKNKNTKINVIDIAFNLLGINFLGFTLYISFDVFIIE